MRKKIFRIAAPIVAALAIATAGFFIWRYDKYVVPIMMYHSVDYENHHVEESGNVVSPEYFRQHMEYLRQFKYNVISIEELVEGLKVGRKFPHNTVVITFDDGYVDNYVYALPILKEYHFPFTVGIISDFVGKEGFMTWDQIKELQKEGATVVSHTRTHLYLPNLTLEELRNQIAGSKKILEQKLGVPVKYFVYPVGGFTEDAKRISKEVGYEAAFTTNRGTDRFNKDLYELQRIRFGKRKPNVFTFRAKLSGYYNLFRQKKASH